MKPERLGTAGGELSAWVRPGERSCLFLHGLGCTKEYFFPAFTTVSGTGRGVIALDLPGCGESDCLPAHRSYDTETQAAMVREALSAAHIEVVVLVFHSLSTLLLPPLLRDLNAVAGVVLIEGNLIPEDAYWSSQIAAMDEASFSRYFFALQRGGSLLLRTMLKRPPTGEDLARLGLTFARSEERAFREWSVFGCQATQSGEALKALSGYTGPKLYLRGDKNNAWSGTPALTRAGTMFRTIPHSGHFPHIDNPDETYRAIFEL